MTLVLQTIKTYGKVIGRTVIAGWIRDQKTPKLVSWKRFYSLLIEKTTDLLLSQMFPATPLTLTAYTPENNSEGGSFVVHYPGIIA